MNKAKMRMNRNKDKIIGRYVIKTVRVSIACAGFSAGCVVEDTESAAKLARAIYAHENFDPDQEHFVILALNAQGRVNGYRHIGTGPINCSLVHPREVFRAAIMLGAVSIVLVHNHPSGVLTPSPDDIELTGRMLECGVLMGIQVVDHVIITRDNHETVW